MNGFRFEAADLDAEIDMTRKLLDAAKSPAGIEVMKLRLRDNSKS